MKKADAEQVGASCKEVPPRHRSVVGKCRYLLEAGQSPNVPVMGCHINGVTNMAYHTLHEIQKDFLRGDEQVENVGENRKSKTLLSVEVSVQASVTDVGRVANAYRGVFLMNDHVAGLCRFNPVVFLWLILLD